MGRGFYDFYQSIRDWFANIMTRTSIIRFEVDERKITVAMVWYRYSCHSCPSCQFDHYFLRIHEISTKWHLMNLFVGLIFRIPARLSGSIAVICWTGCKWDVQRRETLMTTAASPSSSVLRRQYWMQMRCPTVNEARHITLWLVRNPESPVALMCIHYSLYLCLFLTVFGLILGQMSEFHWIDKFLCFFSDAVPWQL